MKKPNTRRLALASGVALAVISLAAWAGGPSESGVCPNDPWWLWEHIVCLFT